MGTLLVMTDIDVLLLLSLMTEEELLDGCKSQQIPNSA
jgi:hypothetical protein